MRLVLAWACVLAFVVACGAAMKPGAAPAASRPIESVQGRPDDLRAQIDTLDADIASRRDAAGLPALPEAMSAGPACTPPSPPPGGCTDVCTLGDAICADADKICSLADQLPGDAWAAGKCSHGKAACSDARQRCCDCR